MSELTQAKDRIAKVFMKWFLDDPMMFGVFTLVEKRPDKTQETIGINTKDNPVTITYNPNFVNTISEEHLETVLASEGFKLMLKHPTTRLLFPENIASLSSNITANQCLNHNFAKIPGLDLIEDLAKEMGLESGRYYEEYFRQLMDRQEDTEEMINDLWDSMSDDSDGDSQSSGSSSGQGQEGDGEGGSGSGQGDDENEDEGSGFKEFKGEQDALENYSNPNGTSNKDWGENSLFDNDIKNFVDEAKTSSRQWGKYTDGMIDKIIVANTPKGPSWKEILRRFRTSVMSMKSVSSRMKVNRRYDLASPGYRRQYASRVLFAIDTSMSMTQEEMSNGMAICNTLLKHADVSYLMFDTKIQRIEHNYKRASNTFKANGRGGTDFQEVMDYAKTEKYDGLIMFTDGCACAPTRPKGVNVLWLLTDKNYSAPVDWGFQCHIDDY